MAIEFRKSDIVGDAQAQVAYWAKARLCDSLALIECVRLSLAYTTLPIEVHVEHVHLSVLCSDVAFLINYRVSQVVAACLLVMLREASQRQPDLVIKCNLSVSVKEVHA